MGGCSSSEQTHPAGVTLTAEQKARDEMLKQKLSDQMKPQKSVYKFLLLGAGECGKSTILKQMQILHKGGYTLLERKQYKLLLRKNLSDSIQTLCQACLDLKIPFESDASKKRAAKILKLSPSADNSKSATDFKKMWADKGIKAAFKRQREFHLLDSCAYLLDDVARILHKDYVPSPGDILRARVATTGIAETSFSIGNDHFIMYDVGGQRGERKRWINCFDNVTAILFIASLNEFDQVLAEDRSRNRLNESLDLFQGIISLPWFDKVDILLFLNKKDLFQEKVKTVDLGQYHSDYKDGKENYEAACKWIEDQYVGRNENKKKKIYVHVTDATNSQNVEFVWQAAKLVVLEKSMNELGAC